MQHGITILQRAETKCFKSDGTKYAGIFISSFVNYYSNYSYRTEGMASFTRLIFRIHRIQQLRDRNTERRTQSLTT